MKDPERIHAIERGVPEREALCGTSDDVGRPHARLGQRVPSRVDARLRKVEADDIRAVPAELSRVDPAPAPNLEEELAPVRLEGDRLQHVVLELVPPAPSLPIRELLLLECPRHGLLPVVDESLAHDHLLPPTSRDGVVLKVVRARPVDLTRPVVDRRPRLRIYKQYERCKRRSARVPARPSRRSFLCAREGLVPRDSRLSEGEVF